MGEHLSPAAKILVCDDEPVLRGLVRASLDGYGYELLEAADGDEALEVAQAERPDLLLLDLMMPGRTGFEVLAELRADPELRTTRVIIFTARVHSVDREAAAAAGADRFLAKPFSPSELAAMVGELLG